MTRMEKRTAGAGARKRVVSRRQKALNPVMTGWMSRQVVVVFADRMNAPGKCGAKGVEVRPLAVELGNEDAPPG